MGGKMSATDELTAAIADLAKAGMAFTFGHQERW
jgi:hypothetical protein